MIAYCRRTAVLLVAERGAGAEVKGTGLAGKRLLSVEKPLVRNVCCGAKVWQNAATKKAIWSISIIDSNKGF